MAIADYTKAIEIDPNYSIAYFGRGTIYAVQNNYDLAISDFNRSIEIDPTYAEAFCLAR